MKKHYVGPASTRVSSSQLIEDFYESALKAQGYDFVDSDQEVSAILTKITSRDCVHIDLIANRKKEWKLLQIMINANYSHIEATLHQPETFWYPWLQLKGGWSVPERIYYKWIGRYRLASKYLSKLKWLYLPDEEKKRKFETRYHLKNIKVLDPKINLHTNQ